MSEEEDQIPDACSDHPNGCPPGEGVPVGSAVLSEQPEATEQEYATGLPDGIDWDAVESIRYCPCGCPVVVLFGAASGVRGLVPFSLDQQSLCPFCYNFDVFGLPERYDVQQMKEVSRARAVELADRLREKNFLYRRATAPAPARPKLLVPTPKVPLDLGEGGRP